VLVSISLSLTLILLIIRRKLNQIANKNRIYPGVNSKDIKVKIINFKRPKDLLIEKLKIKD
jgi:hypothetical protein